MASPSYRIPSPFEEVPLRRRVSGMGLTLALNLLLLLLLIGLSREISIIAPPPQGRTTVIGVSPTDRPVAEEREEQRPKQVEQRRKPPRIEQPKIVLPVPPTIAPPPLDLLNLTKEELNSTDQALAETSRRSAGGQAGDDTPIVGHGPNGETLYAAQWLREPTDQELAGYITKRNSTGYGLIMCKTMSGYRVGDCVALGSVPASARLDRVLMEAAWQFKVRPPRRNGQALIGEWVQIRFDYTARGS